MTADERADLTSILARHAGRDGVLLPILHDVQTAFGFSPTDSVPVIADALNLTRAEVHGVVTFYHDFRREAPAGREIRLCRAEACQARGSRAVVAHLMNRYADDVAAGRLDVVDVYCLGSCATGPNLLLDGVQHSRVTPERLDAMLAPADKP